MIVAVVVGGCVWEGIKKYRGKTKKKNNSSEINSCFAADRSFSRVFAKKSSKAKQQTVSTAARQSDSRQTNDKAYKF